MPAALMNFRVNDFKSWLKYFEDYEPKRREATVTSAIVWQAEGDPNNVRLLLECTDLAKLKRYGQSDELKQYFVKAGVIGTPEMYWLSNGMKYPKQAGQRA